MPYLTPNTNPADTLCRVLLIPNDEEYVAIVRGALQELTFPYNWTLFGALTPDQAASAFVPMFDAFCFDEGVCRVIGEIIAFAGSTSPDPAWLVCDGASLLRTDYPDLFTVIGTTYGAVDGAHFNIPDLQGRSPAGTGTGSGLTPVTLGQAYGEELHTLTVAEIPSHTHVDTGHTHTTGNSAANVAAPGVVPVLSPNPIPALTGSASANNQNTGGDGGHNTIGPRLGVTFLIVAEG